MSQIAELKILQDHVRELENNLGIIERGMSKAEEKLW